VSPWALREGILLGFLSSIRIPEGELVLQPLTFDRSDHSATVTSLVPKN
jgi:exopolyphosphatase/guanosine-5'-triphosphate,3'-diphosphate pyrophosphatase